MCDDDTKTVGDKPKPPAPPEVLERLREARREADRKSCPFYASLDELPSILAELPGEVYPLRPASSESKPPAPPEIPTGLNENEEEET